MKAIIKELEANKQHELNQIGLTPRTDFKKSQRLHDLRHRLKAKKYQKAVKSLEAAPELLKACQLAIKIKDLWLYNEKDTIPEYKGEAQAVSELENLFIEAIKKAKS
jgi:hypothetical protein